MGFECTVLRYQPHQQLECLYFLFNNLLGGSFEIDFFFFFFNGKEKNGTCCASALCPVCCLHTVVCGCHVEKLPKALTANSSNSRGFLFIYFFSPFFAVTLLLTRRDTVCTLRRLRFKMVSSKDHGVIRTLWVMQRLAPLKA